MTPRRSLRPVSVLLLLVTGGSALAQEPPTYASIAPILQERCILCHSGSSAPLGLRLDSYQGLMAGSSNGAVVVPGNPEASELVARLEGRSLPRMPLTGPPFLDEAQIASIKDWVLGGALPGDAPGAPGDAGAGGDDPGAEEPPPADGTFASVEGIFLNRCAVCHTEAGAMGAPPEGLRLDSYDRILRGGDRVVVVPGDPLASEVYRRIVGHSRPGMPFGGPPLTEAEVERIAVWIRAGAPSPDGTAAPVPAGGEVRLGGTLTALWELDGLPLLVTAETRFDEDPGVGDYVEVRGVVTEDGGIRAERIRVR